MKIIIAAATVILLALLCWMAWIRRQYAFGKGGMNAFVEKLKGMGFPRYSMWRPQRPFLVLNSAPL